MNTAKLFNNLNQASTEFGKLIESINDKDDKAFFQQQKDFIDLVISRMEFVAAKDPLYSPKKEK